MQTILHTANHHFTKEESTLADFYLLTGQLSKIRFIKVTGKKDEIDSITWAFTFHKRKFSLQYSIYNGISLATEEEKSGKLISKLADKLHISQS